MNLASVKDKISTYLSSDKQSPIVVDFLSRDVLVEFLDYFRVGSNKVLRTTAFCKEDGSLKIEELLNEIECNTGDTFIVGITAFLKLQGEVFTRKTLKSILSKNVTGHVILLTYQCRDFLHFSDNRFVERGQIIFVDGALDSPPEICLINPLLSSAFPKSYDGFNNLGQAFEEDKESLIHIVTTIKKSTFEQTLLNIQQLENCYDILCEKDSRTAKVSSSLGTRFQWNYALTLMEDKDWNYIVETSFGSIHNIADYISRYTSFDENKRWLYFVALLIFCDNQTSYLYKALMGAENYKLFPRSLFRTILKTERLNECFMQLYNERKEILKAFSTVLDEVTVFCDLLSTKEADAIYYLTDLTSAEKERIITWLSIYGRDYTMSELRNILQSIFPDLANYLSPFKFNNEYLTDYFSKYRYQKITNKLLPTFDFIIEEQSHELKFVELLQPRATIVDKLDFLNAHAYFVDALGVEFLGYIQAKCNEYGLSPKILYGRCELPSLTCFNKEFVETCKERNCPISDIKELDEIKHHGENTFDYEKVKTPIYLIRELEVIDELLRNISASIYNGHYEKAIIFSDHGASRLVVLNESETLLCMSTRGIHSGRCCPINDFDSTPENAIEDRGFWVITNYDRFKGGRKANVEVHGGASLEEVAVPIIEIKRKSTQIEAFIVEDSKIIILAAKETPIIKIYVGLNSENITIRIGDKFYNARKTVEDYLYEVNLVDCKKKGIYKFDILDGETVLASNVIFEIKKKGMSEVSLFD